MSIAVGWYNQTDATFPELGIEIVQGFGSGVIPSLTAAQANTVLKHLDRDVANRIAESAFFTRIPIASATFRANTAIDLGDGRVAYLLSSGNSPRVWSPAGEVNPSWTALSGAAVGVLLDDGEAIWWNNSTTNSAVCAMYRTNGFASGGTILNGTTAGTKAYHTFCKDTYGNYYRITDANVLETSTSLGGTWTAVAAAGTVYSVCPWRDSIVTVSNQLSNADSVKILENGVLVGSSTPGFNTFCRKMAVIEDRMVFYGRVATNTNGIHVSDFGNPLEIDPTPRMTESSVALPTSGQLKFGVSGSVAGMSISTGFAYSVDRGESWKVSSVGGCFDGGRLFNGTSGSLKV